MKEVFIVIELHGKVVTPMIKIENLSKTYQIEDGPEIKALDNVNLEVKKG